MENLKPPALFQVFCLPKAINDCAVFEEGSAPQFAAIRGRGFSWCKGTWLSGHTGGFSGPTV